MRLLGKIEHGVYMNSEILDDCEGLDVATINQHYGIEGQRRRDHPNQSGAGHPLDENDDFSDDEDDSDEEAWEDDSDGEHNVVNEDGEGHDQDAENDDDGKDEECSEEADEDDDEDQDSDSGEEEDIDEKYGSNESEATEEEQDRDRLSEVIAQISNSQETNVRHDPIPVPKHSSPFKTEQDLNAYLRSFQDYVACKKLPTGYGLRRSEWGQDGYPAFENIPLGRRGRKELCISLSDEIWRPRAEVWGQALYLMNQYLYSH